ncbi:putative NAD(P)/FAD-binding protein YdhS [Streptomyces canus]|uniref:NAD(P)/FAD-binding protein YdhS n=1 Tax=Streptomyces canus TaxID=58343 RepID=A0AAW8FPF0_9ACTN|nr:FAD/NAD(P)-binding protein [Streptomyces canus]MDQ0910945.1 putative NAD(P)/FAD-binding protein YdhS [Streptomyces canus]
MPAPTTDHAPVSVALVGAGPRGTSVLERLCASAPELLPPGAHVTVHVIDPSPPGPGRVWRPTQSPDLLMNTVASQVTLFTDESVDCAGPIRPGPSLHEWACGQWGAGCGAEGDTGPGTGDGLPAPGGTPDPGRLSWSGSDSGLGTGSGPCGPLGPDDYPSRAQYGRYLEWVFARIVRQAPGVVSVEVHAARAVRVDDAVDGRQTVTLDDGTVLYGLSAVVLAQGHLPVVADAPQRSHTAHAERHGLHHVPPANPADVDLSRIRPHEPVLLRGLGLNFFDHMALLTTGRGGRFVRSDTGTLRYLPSGDEPRLYAGSRRGIPYQARGDNAKGAFGRHLPLVLTDETISRFRKRADSGEAPDFLTEIWPLVAKEVETVYYEALVEDGEFRDRFLATDHGGPEEAAVLDEFGIPHADRWSWDRISRPYTGQTFTDPGTWRHWLLGHLRQDAAEAALGNVAGPLKAALDVLRDLRNELRQIVDHRGLAGPSRRDHLDRWYTPLNAFLSIGPPRRRIEELTALIEAGTVDVLGPRLEVREADGTWVARSPEVPGSAVHVTTLIEARLPEPDLRRTADDLLARLLKTGQCRPHTVDGYETGGLDVTRRPYHLIDRQGLAHARRFAFGVPTEGVHWVTAAGARPGVDSVTLSDADAVARAVLRATASETGGTTEANEWPNVELASID